MTSQATNAIATRTLPASLKEGRFQLHGELGHGGAARVFKARDLKRGDWVAVKVLDPRAGRHPGRWRRFATEAHMVSGLQHPNILAARDFNITNDPDDVSYIVMDLVEGGSIRDLVSNKGPMSAPDAVRICLDVLCGLAVVHALGVVHRDVKPGNILLDRGVGRLTDFGIARHDLVEARGKRVRMGTRGYAAPELRFATGEASPSTDLYALGATLYAMITGRGPSEISVAQASAECLRDVDPRLRLIILRAMALHPGDRYQSAREMALDLVDVHGMLCSEQPGRCLPSDWMHSFDRQLGNWSSRTIEPSLMPVQRIVSPSGTTAAGQDDGVDGATFVMVLGAIVLTAITLVVAGGLLIGG